uniref:beta-glucosidase n=1 Tax=Arion vulgaris TaxID=1028688 RepID=A0A0B7B209_9EUPU
MSWISSTLMECFFPAQATGDALVAVLTNKGGNSSPAGRLPMTWPMFASQIPPMVNYSMENRTYRYMSTAPLYPFGYGLSYSQFEYLEMILNIIVAPQQDLTVALSVQNVGDISADEVIQCYISWGNQSLPVPNRQLVYFNRILVLSGDIVKHIFTVSWENWSYWDNEKWTVQTGIMTIMCGGQQPFQKKSAPSNILTKTFQVVGTSP